MAETSKNKIYYNDDENSVADVLTDMKKMAESTDKAIENSKYNDAQIKKDISDAKKEQALKDAEQDNKIIELQNEKTELEKELKEAQEDFYQNSIRGQASGEYIHVEDSSNCRSIIGIGGNHEQETREGYNLLDLTSLIGKTETKNGVTYKINEDCSITVNGTPTDYVSFNLLDMSLKAGTYKFVDELDNINNVFLQAIGDFQHTSQNNTFSLAEDGKATVYLVILVGTPTLNNATLYPMIYEGTEDKPYEQYGAMPSPDYRSKVVAVGSNVNELENTAKTQTIKDVTFTVNEDGTVVANGTASQQVTLVLTKVLSLQKGDYMISGCPRGGTTATYRIDVWKSDWSSLGFEVGNGTKISLSESIENAIVGITITKGTTVENMVFKPKIEKGKVATPWSPYGQGCVKVTKCNKNLFPLLKSQSKENKGIIFSYNAETQEFRAKGTTTDTSFYTTVTFEELKYLSKDKKYILSISNLTPKKCMVALTKINVINNGIINPEQKQTTVDNLNKYKPDGFMFYGQNLEKGTKIDFTFKAQIEEGLTETSLTQHEEQSYIMPVQQEMLVNDYLDYDNEEEVHVWGKKIFDGTELWNKSGNKYPTFYFSPYDISSKFAVPENAKGLCNYFKQIGTTWEQDVMAFDIVNITTTHSNVRFCLGSNSTITTLEEWKNKLSEMYNSGQPLVLYFQLRTPIRLKFTDEQKAVAKELNNARTYKNVTNITTDSKAILSLDYAKDLETLLTSKEREV